MTCSPRVLTGPDFPFFFAEVTGLLRCLARLRGANTIAPCCTSPGSEVSNWLCIAGALLWMALPGCKLAPAAAGNLKMGMGSSDCGVYAVQWTAAIHPCIRLGQMVL